MGEKFRYEPPRLVDMRGADLCGQFISCSNGTYQALGSCKESTRCGTGNGAEWCGSGGAACGCDSCCQTGTDYYSTAGYPWVGGCMCVPGGQAYEQCSDGSYTGGMCWSGEWAGNDYCNGGSNVYGYGETENCYSGA